MERQPPDRPPGAALSEGGRPSGAVHHLNRVRDLLFGERAQTLEAQIASIDERLTHEVDTLRAQVTALQSELTDARSALAMATTELTDLRKRMIADVRVLEIRNAELERDSKAQLDERADRLEAQIEAIRALVPTSPVGAETLARALSEVASRLMENSSDVSE